MKLIAWDVLVDSGFSATPEFSTVQAHVTDAIDLVRWPPGSMTFAIYPESGRKRGEGSGVSPIKEAFIVHLREQGWIPEFATFDAYYTFPGSDAAVFVVEWETGNISSSHRAINRMALAMLEGKILGGVLVVPSRALARYLTDRIGNAEELKRYYPLWRIWSQHAEFGYLAIITVEHDLESRDVPRISKGTDGRALG